MIKFIGSFLVVFLPFCRTGNVNQSNNIVKSKYEWVRNWPALQEGFILGQPTGIGIDSDDHIFVFHRASRKWTTRNFPDTTAIAEHTVIELDNLSGRIIHSWGGNTFIMPHGLTVDRQNNIWVTDVGLHQIFKFSHEGKLLLKLGVAKVPGNDAFHFNLPTDIAIAADGCFYVSDGYGNSRVVKFSPAGEYIKSWGTFGTKPGQFIIPHGIAIDQKNTIYVADRQNNRVQLFDTSGKFLKVLQNDMKVEQLPSIAVDNAGGLFAVDYDPSKNKDSTAKGSTIFEFDATMTAVNHFGVSGYANRSVSWFHDLAIDSKGNIFVGDITGLRVLKYKLKK